MYSSQSHMCRCSKLEYKNIHVIIKSEQCESKKMKSNCPERTCHNSMRVKRVGKIKIEWSRAKRAEIFWGKMHFSPNSSKLRSDYLFSYQKRTEYLFPAFKRSEYLFPKSASPLLIKCSSPNYSKTIICLR